MSSARRGRYTVAIRIPLGQEMWNADFLVLMPQKRERHAKNVDMLGMEKLPADSSFGTLLRRHAHDP